MSGEQVDDLLDLSLRTLYSVNPKLHSIVQMTVMAYIQAPYLKNQKNKVVVSRWRGTFPPNPECLEGVLY